MPAAKSKSKTPAKLHSFTKQIVTAGEHFVNGKRRTITEDQMRRWIDNFDTMQAKGYRLPAPFKHRKDAVPMTASAKAKGSDGFALGDSASNAGYWRNLRVEKKEIDGQETPVLVGDLLAYGDPDDLNTPAGKLGKTVEEVSVYAMSNFKDGKGQSYDEALLHIAPVVNPVEMGQPNFVPMGEVDDDALILSMSTALPFKKKTVSDADADQDGEEDASDDDDGLDADSDGSDDDGEGIPAMDEPEAGLDVGPLVQLLEQNGFHLPQDTTEKNFYRHLFVVLNHHAKSGASKDQSDPNAGTINQPPAGTQPKNRNSFAMSIKDPKVLKTFEKQDAARRSQAKDRVQVLATDGVIDAEIAKEMNDEVDAFAMSVVEVDGAYELAPIPVEKTLSILEKSSGRERTDEFGMSHGGTPRTKPLDRPEEKDKKLTPEEIAAKVSTFTSTVRR